MPSPPLTPEQWFAALVLSLSQAVGARTGWDRILHPLIGPIIDRLRGIKQSFARLAATIRAGTYVPRRFNGRRPPANPRPRPPNRLPQKFGWLLPLLPHAAASGSQLQYLFGDPEMVALMAAAPAALRRPLRSLCRMLAVRPPEILALPKKKPPKPRKAKPPRAAREAFVDPRPPTPADAPAWMRVALPRGERWTLTRMCGPKKNRA